MDIAQAIRDAATRYGLNPNVMLRIARTESGFDPVAANPNSSARGVYQFIAPTWARYGNGADPTDAAANIDAGMRFARDNVATLRRGLGREPTPGEIYLAHQQGPAGALNILQHPNQPVGGAAITLNGGREGITGGEFARMWSQRMGGAPPALTGTATDTVSPRAIAQPGVDLSPLAEVMQQLAARQQQPHRRQHRGGPLVLS